LEIKPKTVYQVYTCLRCDAVFFGRQIPMFGMNVGPRFLWLMLEQVPKTLVCVYRITWCNITEDQIVIHFSS